jgi:ArsR family metal-binding transcriptional regulator
LDKEPDAINVDRLCARLFLIADKDTFSSGAKADRHEELQKRLGERFHVLNCKEIENLLTARVLKQVVSTYETGEVNFNDVQRNDYATKPLGRFIETELLASAATRKCSYQTKSGTVSDKVSFCEKAIATMEKYEDLCEEAKEIARKLYDFIAANNR